MSIPKTIRGAGPPTWQATYNTEQGSRVARPIPESQLESREKRVRRGVPPEAHRAAHPALLARLRPLQEHVPRQIRAEFLE